MKTDHKSTAKTADDLNPGQFFYDDYGDLCMRTDEGRVVSFDTTGPHRAPYLRSVPLSDIPVRDLVPAGDAITLYAM